MATDDLKACSGCLSVSYAGREEQKSHWKRHKAVCKVLKRFCGEKGWLNRVWPAGRMMQLISYFLVSPVVVNRKSFGRNRKRGFWNLQFRPKVETEISYLGRKRVISAETGVISAEMSIFAETFLHLPKPKLSAESRKRALSVDHYATLKTSSSNYSWDLLHCARSYAVFTFDILSSNWLRWRQAARGENAGARCDKAHLTECYSNWLKVLHITPMAAVLPIKLSKHFWPGT